MRARDRLVLALDVPSLEEARGWIARMKGEVGVFKVGLELYTAEGPAAVRAVHDAGGHCFLDLKLHDIPATMAKSAAVAADLGVRFLTIHAAAGSEAIAEVRRAVDGSELQVLAVTVLTSLDGAALASVGLQGSPGEAVARLGGLAVNAGAHGLVCSPAECRGLRKALGTTPTLMVPGIRPAGSAAGDQKRIATPGNAIRDGADLLVVGRPIRGAEHPVEAARAIVAEIAEASA